MVIGAADVRSQGHAIGGGGANGGRAPHIHLSDAARNLRYGTKFGYYLLTGQQPLIDHFHLSVLPVDGAHIGTPFFKTKPLRNVPEGYLHTGRSHLSSLDGLVGIGTCREN